MERDARTLHNQDAAPGLACVLAWSAGPQRAGAAGDNGSGALASVASQLIG